MVTLFSGRDLHQILRLRERTALAEVDRYSADEILNLSVGDLCNYLESTCSCTPLTVNNSIDEARLDQGETTFQVQEARGRQPATAVGTLLGVHVQFSGDPELLFCSPSTQNSVAPEGSVDTDLRQITFYYRMLPADDPELVKAKIQRDLDNLRWWVGNVNSDVEKFNASIRETVRRYAESKRERLLKARHQVSKLGIPLAHREGAPRTYAIPEVRKRAQIIRPTPKSEPFAPEPTLEENTYEAILEVLWLMARVMECSPRAVAQLDEEALRFMFLVQLNAQFENRATGETFNFRGKSDILVQAEEGGRSGHVFVAECKVWQGQKHFLATIDQLLRYITWRDTKTAILVFCKNRDFGTVLRSIADTTIEHPNCKCALKSSRQSEFRFTFHRTDDKDREFHLTVLAFHIPVDQETQPS